MSKNTKDITLSVTLQVPVWLTMTKARREVKTLINDGYYWGQLSPGGDDEVGSHNFKALKVLVANNTEQVTNATL